MKEIVIKIPDEAKQAFDNAENNELKGGFYDHGGVIGNAIKNGKVLPKRHGRIVDMNEAINVLIEEWGYEGIEDDMYRVTTLVEADKGEEE